VLPGLPSNKKNSSDHHNSYNKGPNLALFSFMESPSNSLPTIKFPKNLIKSSYHRNLPKTANDIFVHQRALGVNRDFNIHVTYFLCSCKHQEYKLKMFALKNLICYNFLEFTRGERKKKGGEMNHCEPYILFVIPHELILHVKLCDMSHMFMLQNKK
jgi:hypothetical protein